MAHRALLASSGGGKDTAAAARLVTVVYRLKMKLKSPLFKVIFITMDYLIQKRFFSNIYSFNFRLFALDGISIAIAFCTSGM